MPFFKVAVLWWLFASYLSAATDAQLAYREGQHYLAIAIEAREALGSTQPNPVCPSVPMQCELESGSFDQILEQTAKTHNPALLLIRSKAAKQLANQHLARLRTLPESPELHRFQAQELREQAKYRQSAAELRLALRLDPNDKPVVAELAGSLFLEQSYAAVLPELKQLLSRNPASPKLNFFVGHSLFEAQEIEASLPYLQQALKLDASFTPADVSLGLALAKLGRYREAIPHLERARRLDQDGAIYYQLSRAYQATGEPQQAAAALKQYQDRQR